jgi:hypothetical protein
VHRFGTLAGVPLVPVSANRSCFRYDGPSAKWKRSHISNLGRSVYRGPERCVRAEPTLLAGSQLHVTVLQLIRRALSKAGNAAGVPAIGFVFIGHGGDDFEPVAKTTTGWGWSQRKPLESRLYLEFDWTPYATSVSLDLFAQPYCWMHWRTAAICKPISSAVADFARQSDGPRPRRVTAG